MSWRIGSKAPLNVYEDNRHMFQCHTPEEAARIVALLNCAERLDADVSFRRQFDGPHKIGDVVIGYNGRPQRLNYEDALGLTWKSITWREAFDLARAGERTQSGRREGRGVDEAS